IQDRNADRRHREMMYAGRKTFWVAALAVVVPIVLFVISHILSSRPQPSKTDLENSQPSQPIPQPTSLSPEPEANSSNTTPSPEQSATLQPLSTTPESLKNPKGN